MVLGWGWINPIPPWCFGRNSVFLAIGSVLWNCQICLKMMLSIFCCNVVEVRKMLYIPPVVNAGCWRVFWGVNSWVVHFGILHFSVIIAV